MNDAGPTGLSGFLVGVDHTLHPLGLAGEVTVVRAGGRCSGHEFGAVERVGPDG